jgi:glutamine synthetase
MRGVGGCDGLEYIEQAIQKLGKKHNEHMKFYGTGNEERMTGKHETASFDKFTYDVANRGCSIRIGNDTYKNKKGYFEDRRPSSNCDPYLVTGKIFKTTVLES